MPQDPIRLEILDKARALNDLVQGRYNELYDRIAGIEDRVRRNAALHALGQVSERAFFGLANARREIWDAEQASLDAFREEIGKADEGIRKSLQKVADTAELLKRISSAIDTFVQYSAALLP